MVLRIGPAGLGPVKTALATLDLYHAQGFRACEIAFTYGAYIKHEKDARAIGERARALDIRLSIHASYFVNLNASESAKRLATHQRILECCKVGSWLGAQCVVFHPGYYGKAKETSYATIKAGVQRLLKEVQKNAWPIELAPEIMGKINVFGSMDEISHLTRETGSSFCIDVAHLLAREKRVDYPALIRAFPAPAWHVHFSGIIYGDKGEKQHRATEKAEWEELLRHLPRDRDITIINESPQMIEDCIEGLSVAKKLGWDIQP